MGGETGLERVTCWTRPWYRVPGDMGGARSTDAVEAARRAAVFMLGACKAWYEDAIQVPVLGDEETEMESGVREGGRW